jgi:hypothetical protein
VGSFAGGFLEIHVQNGSNVALSGGYVVAGTSNQPVPELAPGASADMSISTPGFLSQALPTYPGSSAVYGSTPATPQQVEGDERNAVFATLLASPSGGNPNATPPVEPVFIGWSTDPQGPQVVNGSIPVTRSETAYVVPIQLTPPPAGTMPPGLVSARMVQAVAGVAPALYEITIPQPGSLGGAAIASSNGGSASWVAQYWDWQAGEWKVATGTYNYVPLPAGAIDRSSGVVRFRMPSTYGIPVQYRLWLEGVS